MCDNEALTSYDGLLVFAPHPDDETLAFAGLITAYIRQGKPVKVVVVTDGDANCDACRFWKNTSLHGPMCNALDLSNFETQAVDSLAEVRRGESTSAATILGDQAPTFLGYPDTGLGVAWLNSRTGRLAKRLRRSDFSRCADCESCQQGYGARAGDGVDGIDTDRLVVVAVSGHLQTHAGGDHPLARRTSGPFRARQLHQDH